jgi:hypothetical protein
MQNKMPPSAFLRDHKELRDTLISLFGDLPTMKERLSKMKILELGSRDGRLLSHLLGMGLKNVQAIDPNPKKMSSYIENLPKTMNIEDMNADEHDTFDLILSNNVMSELGLKSKYRGEPLGADFYMMHDWKVDNSRESIHKKCLKLLKPGGFAVHVVNPPEEIPLQGVPDGFKIHENLRKSHVLVLEKMK